LYCLLGDKIVKYKYKLIFIGGADMDRTERIFGNYMSEKVVNKANRTKQKNIKKYGDDSNVNYKVAIRKNKYLGDTLGIKNIIVGKTLEEAKNEPVFDTQKGIIVGNIRMGFGHYRISMAIASAAHSMGYTPYWMDLNSYKDTTCTKVISAQNDLYSLGSRISQKSRIFNKFVWEPLNYEGFRQLSYNATDQRNAELMAPVFKKIPHDIPVVATHVWPAQAAVHAGMDYVVNAIPDNWPMALHYAEGSLHTVQTHYAYQGYRIGNGMNKKEVVNAMPDDSILYTGHYVDHELVSNIEYDCDKRLGRRMSGRAMRFLLTIGGAGAQKDIFATVIRYLIPYVKAGKAVIYVNVGDYRNVWDELIYEMPIMKEFMVEHFDNWEDTVKFATDAIDGEVSGIHGFCHENIYQAVYCTNLLMRSADVLVTKPSELSFYPIPKLFIKRVGGHEQWGAVHSAEMGDGTLECQDIPHTIQMLDMFLRDENFIGSMCKSIVMNKKNGVYNGAYHVVEAAFDLKNGNRSVERL
jgi:hypothetical protein